MFSLPERLVSRFASLALMSAILTGCVYPYTVEKYDAGCQITAKHMELKASAPGKIDRCRDTADCMGVLAMMGVIGAASTVVSGSIVIAGNVVYWLEKQGRCNRTSDKPASEEEASVAR